MLNNDSPHDVPEMTPVEKIKAWLNDELELTEEEIEGAIDQMTPDELDMWLGKCVMFLLTNDTRVLK